MQKIEELSSDEVARLEAQRKWVREHYPPEDEHHYESLKAKLGLINTILENKWIEPEETIKFQCLGVTFGDALVQELGLKWVSVEDEYGRYPALNFEGTSVIVAPVTVISKRIERGEIIDVYRLFLQACEKLKETKQLAD